MPSPRLRPADLTICRLIHALTASGILVGMMALVAVIDGSPRAAVLLLVVAQLIDGIDGPLARRYDISSVVPRYDGYILDAVIDYVTCVFVPVAFAWQFGVVSQGAAGQITVALVLTTSAMWFSRTDMMTADHWFRGFPATWNLVVPTLWLLDAPHELAVTVLIGLALMSMTSIEFPHPVQVAQWRTANLASCAIWVGSIVALTVEASRPVSLQMAAVLMMGPAWMVVVAVARRLADTPGYVDSEPASVA